MRGWWHNKKQLFCSLISWLVGLLEVGHISETTLLDLQLKMWCYNVSQTVDLKEISSSIINSKGGRCLIQVLSICSMTAEIVCPQVGRRGEVNIS
jgi:hypothetical protein